MTLCECEVSRSEDISVGVVGILCCPHCEPVLAVHSKHVDSNMEIYQYQSFQRSILAT